MVTFCILGEQLDFQSKKKKNVLFLGQKCLRRERERESESERVRARAREIEGEGEGETDAGAFHPPPEKMGV